MRAKLSRSMSVATLDELAEALGVGAGDLIVSKPEKRKRGSGDHSPTGDTGGAVRETTTADSRRWTVEETARAGAAGRRG